MLYNTEMKRKSRKNRKTVIQLVDVHFFCFFHLWFRLLWYFYTEWEANNISPLPIHHPHGQKREKRKEKGTGVRSE